MRRALRKGHDGKPEMGPCKTARSRRSVVISPTLVELLAASIPERPKTPANVLRLNLDGTPFTLGEVLIAGVYGVDPGYNAFVSVSGVPNVVQQLFADAAISAALVPVLVALLAAGDVQHARRVTGSLLGFMLLVVGAVVLAIVVAAEPIVRLS